MQFAHCSSAPSTPHVGRLFFVAPFHQVVMSSSLQPSSPIRRDHFSSESWQSMATPPRESWIRRLMYNEFRFCCFGDTRTGTTKLNIFIRYLQKSFKVFRHAAILLFCKFCICAGKKRQQSILYAHQYFKGTVGRFACYRSQALTCVNINILICLMFVFSSPANKPALQDVSSIKEVGDKLITFLNTKMINDLIIYLKRLD